MKNNNYKFLEKIKKSFLKKFSKKKFSEMNFFARFKQTLVDVYIKIIKLFVKSKKERLRKKVKGDFALRMFLKKISKISFFVSLFVFIVCFSYLVSAFNEDMKITKISKDGKIVSASVSNSGFSLNPLFANMNRIDSDLTKLLFKSLIKYNPKTQEFEQYLAFFEPLENETKFRFTIKDNMLWSDGSPITADDIMFTVGIIKDASFEDQNLTLYEDFKNVEIKKINKKTVEFKVPSKDVFFQSKLLFGILPKKIFEKIDDYKKIPKGIYSGPFKLKKIKKENENQGENEVRTIILERNDKYFKNSTYLKEMHFKYFKNFHVLKQNLDEIDIVQRMQKENKESFSKEFSEFDLFDFPVSSEYVGMFLNMKNNIFKNINVRRAMSLSINKEVIIEEAGINGTMIHSPIYDEKIKMKYNKKYANGALYDAGWKLDKENKVLFKNGEDFVRKKFNKNFEIRMLVPNKKPFVEIANFVKKDLKDIGIILNLDILDTNEFKKKLNERDYDVVILSKSLGYNRDMFAYWHSSQDKNGNNFSQFKNADIDNLIKKMRDDSSEKGQIYKLMKLNKMIAYQFPAIFLYSHNYTFAVKKDRIINNPFSNKNLKMISISDRMLDMIDFKVDRKEDKYEEFKFRNFFSWLDKKIYLPF